MKLRQLYEQMTNVTIREADLLNKISDYRGGVAYKLYDPATAENVKNDILQYAAKHQMQVIKSKFEANYGFIYFRLGDDPGKESQRIQGFVSQLPEVEKFKFTTLSGEESAPAEQPAEEPAPAAAPAPADSNTSSKLGNIANDILK